VSPLSPSDRAELEAVFAAEAPERAERLADGLARLSGGRLDGRAAVQADAHALRGAAASAGRKDLADLARSIEELLEEPEPDPEELAAAARLLRQARLGAKEPDGRAGRAKRLIPHGFMPQLAVIVFLALVPALAAEVYDTTQQRRNARSQVEREARIIASLGAESQRQVLVNGERLLELLGETPELRSGSATACNRLLARYATRFGPYQEFGVIDAAGTVTCASVALPRGGVSVAELPSFRAAREAGRFTVGGLERGVVGGRPVVRIAKPIRRDDGQTVLVGANIDLRELQRLLGRAHLPLDGAMAVFDQRGRVLARRPDPQRYVGSRADVRQIRALSRVSGTKDEEGLDGVRRIYAYAEAGPWYLRVGIPTKPAYSALTQKMLRELLLVAVLAAIGFGLALAGARRSFVRPLRTLVETTRRLGAGELGARTGIGRRGGELGELATSVDLMADSLERRTAERERAVMDLGRLTHELESRIRERTAALEAARQEADRASEAKTAFVARLSHELRTPLNAMRGFSQILAGEELPPDQAEAARHVSAAAEHMTALVDELLDTARIEAGQFRLELSTVHVATVVASVVELAGSLAAEHDVTIALQEPEAGLAVVADGRRLRQALLNVVTNGITYNRRGGTVALRVDTASADRVRLDVIDTGPGIAPGDLDRVFTPYDRLGLGPETSGLGIGLALSKRLVEAMGGTISVESELDVGTRFTIDLARAEAAAAPGDVPPEALPARDLGRRRVLYIEDNLTSMKLVELLVRGPEIEFVGKTTAAEGLAAAREERPDLILLDLELPDRSGEDVLRELRAEPALRAVPIVMLSGVAERESVRRLLEAGADDYLTKPIELDRAAEVIDRFLRRSAS
jgi:signal transduction histidine kinase/HPt (histidine-containing phosphotransfer) domain-containing protein